MAQTKTYSPTWIGIYRSDSNKYVNANTPIRVGGSQGYNSYLGFPTALREDIKSSRSSVKMKVLLQVTDGGEFDVGAHKESSNKASNGLPWYEYIGIHPVLSAGAREIDITSFVTDFKNNTRKGIVLYGGRGAGYGEAAGLNKAATAVKIQLTGDWDDPPTAPKMTYPVGNETLSGRTTLQASPATDTETAQSLLQYQFSIYDGSWHDLARGAAGITSAAVDFTQYKETSQAKARVRAWDGIQYGPWAESPGVFSIRRNVAPKTPLGLFPSGESIDRTQVIQFSWTHNDTDGQSKFELRYRPQGSATWATVNRSTPEEFHYFYNNFFTKGSYEWQVRTYDQQGLESPWSNTAVFVAADPTAKPVILRPDDGGIVTESRPVISWSAADQTAYQLEVWESGYLVYDFERFSTNRAETLGMTLENGQTYTIKLRTIGANGLLSEWVSVTVTVEFTPPMQPLVYIENNWERGSFEITVDNPAPESDEPTAVYNDIYRKEESGEWIRVKTRLTPNGTFVDYSPRSETEYQYKAIAIAANGTSRESEIEIGIIRLNQVILEVATNPDLWVSLLLDPQKKFSKNLDKQSMKFLGRVLPAAEFGPGEEKTLDLSFTVYDFEDLERLEQIIDARQPVLYRDRRRRRMFITIDGMDVTDQQPDFYSVSFKADQNDYKEEVGT